MNIDESLRKLSSGALDAILTDLPVATYYIQKLGLTNLKVAGNTVSQTVVSTSGEMVQSVQQSAQAVNEQLRTTAEQNTETNTEDAE